MILSECLRSKCNRTAQISDSRRWSDGESSDTIASCSSGLQSAVLLAGVTHLDLSEAMHLFLLMLRLYGCCGCFVDDVDDLVVLVDFPKSWRHKLQAADQVLFSQIVSCERSWDIDLQDDRPGTAHAATRAQPPSPIIINPH